MNKVSDYQAKGVVFVEGDVIRHSQLEQRMDVTDCNQGLCDRSIVESFTWRNITGAVPVPHSMDLSMVVEVDCYYDHKNFGIEQLPVNAIKWGQPTVHKAWRPIAPGQYACCSACNYEWKSPDALTAPCPDCGDVPVQPQYQPLVRAGVSLYYHGVLVEVMAISNGTICVKQPDGELDLVQDANKLKSPDEYKRVADICDVLSTSYTDVTDTVKGRDQFTHYAEALIKAGYRKESNDVS